MVLKECGRKAQSKSYLWLQCGGPPEQPVVLYHYDPGHGAGVAKRLLEGFKGYSQTDGYDGYNAAESDSVKGVMASASLYSLIETAKSPSVASVR